MPLFPKFGRFNANTPAEIFLLALPETSGIKSLADSSAATGNCEIF